MGNFKLYKEMYYNSLEMKEKINSKLSIHISVVTLLISALGYLVKPLIKLQDIRLSWLYIIILLVYMVATIRIIVLIMLVYYGYSYKYVTAKNVREFECKTEKYYDQYYKEFGEEKENYSNSILKKR